MHDTRVRIIAYTDTVLSFKQFFYSLAVFFLSSLTAFGKDTKLIYRHYATLYFVIAVDNAESELGILDLIQVFVEVLDKCFEPVCELDVIFHSDKVHYILDEVVMGGMVLETNIGEIFEAVQSMKQLEESTKTLGIRA